MRRHILRHQRLDVADHNPFDARVRHERSRRHSRPARHHQHRFSASGCASAEICPSIRCNRMSRGSFEACTLPAEWKLRTPSVSSSPPPSRSAPRPHTRNTCPASRPRARHFLSSATMPGASRVAVSRQETPISHHAPRQHRHIPRQHSPAPPPADQRRATPLRRAPAPFLGRPAARRSRSSGPSTSSPDTADTPINIRWHPCVPTSGITTMLNPSDADNRAHRVRGIHPAHQPPRILPPPRHRRQRQRKTRAPQNRRRQNRPQSTAPYPVGT